MKNACNARRTAIEISNMIMKGEDALRACKNKLHRVRAKHSMMNDEEIAEENENPIENDKDNNNAIQNTFIEDNSRKERDFKPYEKLSARRKKHRIREAKSLIMKIANPDSNDKEEHVDRCMHILEDVLN